jgi:hypothetical protein
MSELIPNFSNEYPLARSQSEEKNKEESKDEGNYR